jgi:S1-C subfamily serine protease
VKTNEHVIDGDECDIHDNSDRAIWNLDITNLKSWNRLTDQAIVKITATQYQPYPLSEIPTINAISKIPNCPLKMPTDSQVIVMGYPGSTGGFRPMALQSLTVTRGIISAYSSPILGATSNDDALALESLPDQNYYVDAQIDSGNSGGLALSKSNGSLCLLGIPTWVSLTGHFQAPGIVQSMNNIMYGK